VHHFVGSQEAAGGRAIASNLKAPFMPRLGNEAGFGSFMLGVHLRLRSASPWFPVGAVGGIGK
jgi:hypothetical protein